MCAITFLKACTLSRISSASFTFYIQTCFYSELLEKKIFPSAKLKKIISRNCQVSHWKKKNVDYFRSKKAKKMFLRKKNFDCKSPMKWPIYKTNKNHEILDVTLYSRYNGSNSSQKHRWSYWNSSLFYGHSSYLAIFNSNWDF